MKIKGSGKYDKYWEALGGCLSGLVVFLGVAYADRVMAEEVDRFGECIRIETVTIEILYKTNRVIVRYLDCGGKERVKTFFGGELLTQEYDRLHGKPVEGV